MQKLFLSAAAALALLVTFGTPSVYYIYGCGANAEWTLASLIGSNVPSVVGTLMLVVLLAIAFRNTILTILGAPTKH